MMPDLIPTRRARVSDPALLLLALLAGTAAASAAWQRNTFPGPGNVANPGPWGPGQGTDRTEWISFFRVHPANPHFMLQGTDLGRLVYTNTALGGTEFIAAEVPLRHCSGVGFDPHHAGTAYVLLDDPNMPGLGGWWKTTDEGVSWRQLIDTPAPRGQLGLLWVNPNPAKANEVYAGTFDKGVYRSLNGGQTFSQWLFNNQQVHHMAINPDGSALFVIIGSGGGSLTRVDLSNGSTQSYGGTTYHFIDAHPAAPDTGIVVVGDSLRAFTLSADKATFQLGSTLVTKATMRMARHNPANAQHIIMTAEGGFTGHFQWSTDGGATWNQWTQVGADTPNLVDYAPHNHHQAPEYDYTAQFPPNSIRGQYIYDFVPGHPSAALLWETGYYKGPKRSDDYGANFAPFAHGGNFKAAAQIAIGSTDRVRAIALIEGGVLLTQDGGLSWRAYHRYNTPTFPTNSDSPTWRYRSTWGVAIHPANDNIVMATVGWAPVRVMRTENFGAAWAEVGQIDSTTVPEFGDRSLNIQWDMTDPSRLYVHTIRNTNGGISISSGLTLTPGNTLLSRPVTTISSSNGALVLSKVTGADWSFSQNAGSTWTALPTPPMAADGVSRAVTPNRHFACAIDPAPNRDPTLDPANRLRILIGGEGGVWQFVATNSSGSSGAWSLIPNSATVPQPHVGVNWLATVAFDPRPGHGHNVYAFPSYAGAGRGQLFYRQIYKSADAGATWSSAYASGLKGDLPDYMSAGAAAVSRSTGRVFLYDHTGLYSLSSAPALVAPVIHAGLASASTIEITLPGEDAYYYRLETSSDLQSWQPSETVAGDGTELLFTRQLPAGPGEPAFFRVSAMPAR